jgi:hypothetical protein
MSVQSSRPVSVQAGSGADTAGGGALKRGSTGTRTAPSIPSKFETLVNTSERAKDGFGSRTDRNRHADTDYPGERCTLSPEP